MPPKSSTSNQGSSDQFNQIRETIKDASNVLVTVSANPSVDQLSACIALTLALNKLGKHATAVFSGRVPSTIEFLKPEETLEKNTDSLRDFIISLDKSKADKLRYKVEDNVVRIFITPYRTSISDKDLEFTQGDFNVDAVITLGVRERADLDAAIVAHGRILHTATMISINSDTQSDLGSINWQDKGASSLCEMVADLIADLDQKQIDGQIATALLTGMVAETDRFGNEKVSPRTMSISGSLMAAGANPQLIASKLDEPHEPAAEIPELVDVVGDNQDEGHDGMIEIDHDQPTPPVPDTPEPKAEEPLVENIPEDEIHIDENGKIYKGSDFNKKESQEQEEETPTSDVSPGMIKDPPQFGGQLTSNTVPEEKQYAPAPDPLTDTRAVDEPASMLNHGTPSSSQPSEPAEAAEPSPPEPPPSDPPFVTNDTQTLAELEEAVHSPHVTQTSSSQEPVPELAVDKLSEAAKNAAALGDDRPHPLESIGAAGDLTMDHADESPQPSNDAPKPPDNPPPSVPPPLPPQI